MPRKPRIEFEGAVYHVMSRGNRQERIFRDARDYSVFLDTLGESVQRCGWCIHAYALMGNHYHLLLETPEPNLVAGMKWLQGTYTVRHNVRHQLKGHLFQGRYKALLVESADHYFMTLSTYIHLNPARIKGYDFENRKLEAYTYSSYPGYIHKPNRQEWLCVNRVLDCFALEDTPSGRRAYKRQMDKRVLEIRFASEPWRADEHWDHIRRGWYVGGEHFRKDLLKRLDQVFESNRRESYSGGAKFQHGEDEAIKLLEMGLEALGLRLDDLAEQKKGSAAKYAIAWLIRQHTSVPTSWIKERLMMGTATNFASRLKRLEGARRAEWGHQEGCLVKNIKI